MDLNCPYQNWGKTVYFYIVWQASIENCLKIVMHWDWPYQNQTKRNTLFAHVKHIPGSNSKYQISW